jgi:CRP/FNR family transcriptional regulator
VPLIDVNRSSFQAKKGELIFREGEEVKGIYFVYSGSVKVHKKWGSEKELIVRFAKKGDIVGHRGLGKDNLYPISATALEPVTVCFIALDFFQASLKVNHEVLFQLMMFFAEELKESERKMRNLAHMPVKGRIAQALLTLREKFGLNTAGFIDIVLSRQDLASYSGTTYETVFRIMGELVQEGAISVAGKQIAIVDEERLVGFTKEGEG